MHTEEQRDWDKETKKEMQGKKKERKRKIKNLRSGSGLFTGTDPMWLLSASWMVCVSLVAQACPTLCNPMDCSLPGSSVHGVFQARILEWVAIFSSRGSSLSRDQTCVSCFAGGFFTPWAIGEALSGWWPGQDSSVEPRSCLFVYPFNPNSSLLLPNLLHSLCTNDIAMHSFSSFHIFSVPR